MTLISQSRFPPIIPNGSRLWTPEAFSRRWDGQTSYKGRGGPVEPATVAKVKVVNDCDPWTTPIAPQAGSEAPIGLINKDSINGRLISSVLRHFDAVLLIR